MTSLEKHEERLQIYARDRGICQFCKKPVSINEFQVAHIIANAKWARKKYGSAVIDHKTNKCCTHPGKCNDGVLITFKPVEAKMHADKIFKEINNQENTTPERRGGCF